MASPAPGRATDETPGDARNQQQVEELCAAAIRALSGETNLHFRGRRLHRGDQLLAMHAPHLYPSLETDDFGSFRGAADGMALRLLHCDAGLHARLRPDDPVRQLVFDVLEQIRVESLTPKELPGVAHNLRHRYERWSMAFHQSGLTETASGVLLYAVMQIARARVSADPVLEATEDLLETTRGALVPMIGADLAGLRRHRHSQHGYAMHALSIARTVAGLLDAPTDHAADREERDDEPPDRAGFSLLLDYDDAGAPIATAGSGRSRVLQETEGGYRAFTTAYDHEYVVSERVAPTALRRYREQLDRVIAGQPVNRTRLSRALTGLLSEPDTDGWVGGQEEGYIDGRRLAQLISSPTVRDLFRSERVEPVPNSVVGFLIDCSGSMKEHAEQVAVLVEAFVRALEQAGVACEVLGFTTAAWNGGRALKDWQRAGTPRHPGRLNEARHLVFKSADVPWRHARPGLAGLLKIDLFKEGIDGEAVTWACRRLVARPEEKRVLFVLSDGSPMDSATNRSNDVHYLDHHLQDVIAEQARLDDVEILGLGVGLDLSLFYSRSLALDLSRGVGNEICREIVELLAGRHQR